MNRREFIQSTLAAAALGAVAGLPSLRAGENTAGGAGTQVARRKFKDTTLPLLGFGMMRLPRLDPAKPEIDPVAAQALVDRAMAAGVNYFDTAYPYHSGLSETFVGAALKKYPRAQYYLASKLPVWAIRSASDMERIFNEQLQKCQVEYFDVYLLHALNKDNWAKVKQHKMYEFLAKKKAAGQIRNLGFSFHDEPELLQAIVAAHPWDIAQIQLNYVDWELYRSREQYEILTKAHIPVVVMEPLRGATLATLTPKCLEMFKQANPMASAASWAFRYVGSLPNVVVALSGMTYMEHLEDNIRTFSDFKPLTDAERQTLAAVTKVYHHTGAVPCTNCKYCMPCPVGVNIPRIFGLYNSYKTTGEYRRYFGRIYAEFAPETMASACVNCGACVKKCPQHINIPEELRKIHAEYTERSKKVAWNAPDTLDAIV